MRVEKSKEIRQDDSGRSGGHNKIRQGCMDAILIATRKRRGPDEKVGLADPGKGHSAGLFYQASSAQGGSSSMVEHQFSKLITRVRFPPSAPLALVLCQTLM